MDNEGSDPKILNTPCNDTLTNIVYVFYRLSQGTGTSSTSLATVASYPDHLQLVKENKGQASLQKRLWHRQKWCLLSDNTSDNFNGRIQGLYDPPFNPIVQMMDCVSNDDTNEVLVKYQFHLLINPYSTLHERR